MGTDVLRESHENGIASFLGGGAGAGVWTLVGGGGPQGIPARFPERPFVRAGSLGGGTGASVLFSSEVVVVERDRVGLAPFESPSCTSSNDDVERRRAVSSGELEGAFPDICVRTLVFGSEEDESVETVGSCETRGVVAVEEDSGRSVNERMDVEDFDSRDSGRDVVSGASSKLSYRTVRDFSMLRRNALLTPSLSEISALDIL